MTILIIDCVLKEISSSLDDAHLDSMIKTIANILLSVAYSSPSDIKTKNKEACRHWNKIKERRGINDKEYAWANWALENIENYQYLCDLGLDCLLEYYYRKNNEHKYHSIISWCIQNKPSLSKCNISSGKPLTMPDHFKTGICDIVIIHKAYRRYYQHLVTRMTARKVKCPACDGYAVKLQSYARCEKCSGEGAIKSPVIPKWTKREKPDWIQLVA
jgi:hypothetical protein